MIQIIELVAQVATALVAVFALVWQRFDIKNDRQERRREREQQRTLQMQDSQYERESLNLQIRLEDKQKLIDDFATYLGATTKYMVAGRKLYQLRRTMPSLRGKLDERRQQLVQAINTNSEPFMRLPFELAERELHENSEIQSQLDEKMSSAIEEIRVAKSGITLRLSSDEDIDVFNKMDEKIHHAVSTMLSTVKDFAESDAKNPLTAEEVAYSADLYLLEYDEALGQQNTIFHRIQEELTSEVQNVTAQM
jgi:hypothetical protein